MLPLVIWSVLLTALTGLGVKLILDRLDVPQEITWKEYGVGMALICVILVPLTVKVGWAVSRDNLVEYAEYRNGWEVSAIKEEITCSRDGPCQHEYDCDPYRCNPHDCNCSCVSRDSNGNCTRERCDTCYDTCYHDCPYVTSEYTYSVDTTLGRFTIDSYRFPENPQRHRWSRFHSIPGHVIERAGVGDPSFWTEAQRRIACMDPGPVTKRYPYNNYILASDRTILKTYSKDIDRYLKAGLFPRLSTTVRDFYLADKAHFVGISVPNRRAWEDAVGKLDAALGSELQGDLHLVIVKNDAINSNPDNYTLALKAYWQNVAVFGHDALAKNAIGCVVGTADGQTVTWARAFTGMPMGNEGMLLAIQHRLKGKSLNPETVVGVLKGELSYKDGKAKVKGLHGSGLLETVLWGLDDPSLRFRRYSMEAKHPGDIGGGYLYLFNEIQPTGGQQFAIGLCCFFLCGGVWVAAAYIGERVRSSAGHRSTYGKRLGQRQY